MDIESYIKDLSPELQEKVRACKSVDELLTLAKENSIAIPDEALSSIAGGQDSEDVGKCNPSNPPCPKCKGTNVESAFVDVGITHYRCCDCGHEWME